jgi:hypothetical protein
MRGLARIAFFAWVILFLPARAAAEFYLEADIQGEVNFQASQVYGGVALHFQVSRNPYSSFSWRLGSVSGKWLVLLISRLVAAQPSRACDLHSREYLYSLIFLTGVENDA